MWSLLTLSIPVITIMSPEMGDQYKPLEGEEEMSEIGKSDEECDSDNLTVEDLVNRSVL